MSDFKISSPDGTKSIELSYVTELHFGPMVCTASSSGFDLPDCLGEVLEFVNWSENSRFLTLCKSTYDSKTGAHEFVLLLLDTENLGQKEILKSNAPIRVKELSDAGAIKIN